MSAVYRYTRGASNNAKYCYLEAVFEAFWSAEIFLVGRVLANAGKMSETESTQPNKNKIKTLSSMTVPELKKYLQMRGVTVNGYLKPGLLGIAQAVEKMMLPVEPIMIFK